MAQLPFDPQNPPDEPPAGVRQPMLWRLAARLCRDHDRAGTGAGSSGRCRTCGAPWPCLVRRTAERGLRVAFHDPPQERPAPPADPGGAAGPSPESGSDPP